MCISNLNLSLNYAAGLGLNLGLSASDAGEAVIYVCWRPQQHESSNFVAMSCDVTKIMNYT